MAPFPEPDFTDLSRVTFNVDNQLADAIGQAIVDRTKAAGIRQGDILITLMSVAKGLIESHDLTSDVKAYVMQACVARLTDPSRKGSTKFVAGHSFKEPKDPVRVPSADVVEQALAKKGKGNGNR